MCVVLGGGVWFGFFNVRLVIVLVELGKKKGKDLHKPTRKFWISPELSLMNN